MSDLSHTAHLLLPGIWLVSILVGFVVQIRSATQSATDKVRRAELQWKLDSFIKVPVLIGVFVSGASLLAAPHASGQLFLAMILPGLMAVFLGIFGVWLSSRRRTAARAGKWRAFSRIDSIERSLETVIFVGVLGAATAGILSRTGSAA